ncbi:hypothetical protein [Nocardia stercoris]|uniref:hypothetical protein n=1 Tax=Nocardia stercoris TaxID=2483361 RepID=UPI0011C347FA|nr:hypothetical protein [Nocardia stercoris]
MPDANDSVPEYAVGLATPRRPPKAHRGPRHALVESFAVFCGAYIAGLALLTPLDLGTLSVGPALETTIVIFNLPEAMMAAAALAVGAASFAAVAGARFAWSLCTICALLLLVDSALPASRMGVGTLELRNFVDCLAAGAMLGALAAVSLHFRGRAPAYLSGVLTGIVIGAGVEIPKGEASTLGRLAAGVPPTWLLAFTAIMLGVCLYWHRTKVARTASTMLLGFPIAPILAITVVLITIIEVSDWLDRHRAGLSGNIAGVILIVLAGWAAALLLPGRDGILTLQALAVGATAFTVVTVPRPAWIVPCVFAAVALGLTLGSRWPASLLSITASIAASLFGIFVTDATDAMVPVIGCLLLALVAGYCFGSTVTRSVVGTVQAIAALVVPYSLVALRGRGLSSRGHMERFYRDPHQGVGHTPGILVAVIAALCGLGVVLVRWLRPTNHPT